MDCKPPPVRSVRMDCKPLPAKLPETSTLRKLRDPLATDIDSRFQIDFEQKSLSREKCYAAYVITVGTIVVIIIIIIMSSSSSPSPPSPYAVLPSVSASRPPAFYASCRACGL